MTRAIVNVATGAHYNKGQTRLLEACAKFSPEAHLSHWRNLPVTWPKHEDKPYAWKSYALEYTGRGFDSLIWADACILPVRSLEPAWAKIERDGYLLMRNGFSNATWTAESAYPDLFGVADGVPSIENLGAADGDRLLTGIEAAKHLNRDIPHTVGGFFGLSMRHEIGREFLKELYRLASETRAFCGPWDGGVGVQHRHDQSCMSVIAWRLGMVLSDPPEFLVYGKAQDAQDSRTVVVADGSYA